jgi:predicted SprT family Zn-dependent metalloprotease
MDQLRPSMRIICFEYKISLVFRVVLSCLQDGPVTSILVHHEVVHYFVYQCTGSIAVV